MRRTTHTPTRLFILIMLLAALIVGGGALSSSVLAQPVPAMIHDIQGAGHLSPLNGMQVTEVPGIVTATVARGFYMQTPDDLVDDDPATSEGILVFTSSAPTVSVGDEVLVDGTVTEFYPGGFASANLSITEIINPTVTVVSSGNDLPAPTIIGIGGRMPPTELIDDISTGDANTKAVFDPETNGLDFYESLEGMLVQVNDPLAVGPTNNFGEIPLVADNGANAGVFTLRGGLALQPTDPNPERIITDDVIITDEPRLVTGDRFDGPIIGVLDYSFGNFKLLNTEPFPDVIPSNLERELADASGPNHLRVATFNVENLHPNVPAGKLAGLAETIIVNLGSPDIVALQEIQDNSGPTNDGVVAADQTYMALIDAITAAGGPTYTYLEVAPENNQDGGAPGANIRVGYLYRPDRLIFSARPGADATTGAEVVMGAAGPELTLNPGRVDPTNPAFAQDTELGFEGTRKSLAAEFLFNGRKIFVINSHFKSKSGDNPLFGRVQPPVQVTLAQRVLQGEVVNDFASQILALDPSANVIVLGDMNDFDFSDTLAALKGDNLSNLVDLLPLEDRYTFIFDGNSQMLDHILVNGHLLENHFDSVDIVHVNVDYPSNLRSSDHEPILMTADFTAPPFQPGADAIWRFRGYTYQGQPGDQSTPQPGVVLHLYGRNAGQPAPGSVIASRVSDASGFWNFFVTATHTYDIYRVVALNPAGMVSTGAESQEGFILDNNTIEWFQPTPRVYLNAFYFDLPPTPTPTPTFTATPTETLTPEPTDTPTPEPTSTPTSTPTATPEPTDTPTPEPTATPTMVSYRVYMPLLLRPMRPVGDTVFELTILHNNDGESRIINAGVGLEDFGGIARFATLMSNLRAEATASGEVERDVLVVTSGDNFLAGPEFNASLEKGVPYYDSIALHYIGYDALDIGNHDFDFGPDVTADFIEGFFVEQPGAQTHVEGPVFLSANLDFSGEPRLQALVDEGKIAKSAVFLKGDQEVGVIGLTTPLLPFISSPRNVVVDPDVVGAVMGEVEKLQAEGVQIIVLISHLQSVQQDLALVSELSGVDIVIAGGGDEVLGDPADLYVPGDETAIAGTYPLWAADKDGVQVPVVTTAGDYRYIGRLVAGFDSMGQLTAIDEDASKMVRVAGGANEDAVEPDPYVQEHVVDPVAAYVADLAAIVIGQSEVALQGARPQIRVEETNLGNLMADALWWQATQLAAAFGVPEPDIALQNGGGIRNNNLIPAGDITELTTFAVAPFANFTSVVPVVTPEELQIILENAYSRLHLVDGRFAHIAGMQVMVDLSQTALVWNPEGTEIVTMGERVRQVVLSDGTVMIADGEIAGTARDVSVATIDFLARGGDQYAFPEGLVTLGVSYQQALRNYIVNGLGGQITAAQYPEEGAGRILIDAEPSYQLTVLHNNDGESRIINAGVGLEDFGGIARFATLMSNLRAEATASGEVERDVLVVTSGDNFLAGPEFNASLEKGVPYYDSIAMHYIGYDALDIGNHDFDFGPDVMADFIEGFYVDLPEAQTHVEGPVFLSANLDFSGEPRLQALVDEGKIAASAVFTKSGQEVGVIGLTTPLLPFISSPRNVVVDADVVGAVQGEIDALTADGVQIIVLISHLQSVQQDLALVSELSGVDIVIAGGGDEVLGDPADLYVPGDETAIAGPYPLWAGSKSGALVPVVTTAGDYRYIGQLAAQFDERGVLVGVDHEVSKMVRVAGGDNEDAVEPDPYVQEHVVDPVAAYVAGLAANVIGQSEVALEGRRPQIRVQETNLGNLMADALWWQATQLAGAFGVPAPDIAMQNGGGIRNNNLIPAGDITELTTFAVAPFANFTSVVPVVTPEELQIILENAYSRLHLVDGRFAHIAGMQVMVDLSQTALVWNPEGTEIVTMGERVRQVVLSDGTVMIADGEIAGTARDVSVATIDFLARGGDQYAFPEGLVTLGVSYQQALRNYIVNGLGGQITAAQYPEGGAGRILIDAEPSYQLTVLHNNDGESRIINAGVGLEDFGGIARFATLMADLRAAATAEGEVERDVLVVTSGDNFLAGPEFNASLEKGVPYYDSIAMHYIGYDALDIGNHDFDFGPDVTADFIEGFFVDLPEAQTHVEGPVFLSANLDFSGEPRLQALVDEGKIAASAVFTKSGQEVGVIGLTTPLLPFISSPRNVVVDPNVVGAVQGEIDALTADGVQIIVLISHLQSMQQDLALVPQLSGVDIVIAGGGDEVLGDPADLYVPGDETAIAGTYPLWVGSKSGALVPVVTTAGDYRYIGQLAAQFDERGVLVGVDHEVSKMVRVAGGDNEDAVEPDPYVQEHVVDPVAAYVAGLAANVIGQSEVALEGRRPQIRVQETNLGNLMADALWWQATQLAAAFGAPEPDIAMQNGGGIRNNNLIPAGDITELTTFAVAPFANFTSVVPVVTPEELQIILENAYSRLHLVDGRFAHIAGMQVEVDLSQTALVWNPEGTEIVTMGERVRQVVLDDGTVMIEDGEIAGTARDVSVATIDFLARGGDQYAFPEGLVTLGVSYQQALRNYIVNGLGGQITAAQYPEGGEGRITLIPE